MATHDGSGFWSNDDWLSPEIARFLFPREDTPMRESVVAGARAGIVGAIVASALLVLAYVRHGGSPAMPAQILAFEIVGDASLAAGGLGVFSAAVVSLAGGLAFGAFFGVLMARLVGRIGVLGAVGVGGIYGLLVWLVTQFVIVAFLAPRALLLYDQQTLAISFAVYGMCLGLIGRAYKARSWFV